jgi:hypothetical protein
MKLIGKSLKVILNYSRDGGRREVRKPKLQHPRPQKELSPITADIPQLLQGE